MANIGEYSIFNIIAKEKDFFEKNGLDVQMKEYDSGATSMAALLSGKADVAVAADFVGVINMFNNPNLRVLAEVSNHDVFRVIARKDKGISSPSDLKGKTIGVTQKTAAEFYLGRFLTFNNTALADVKIVNLSPKSMIDMLNQGTLDAIVTFEPHAYKLEQSMGDNLVVWSAQGDQRALGLVYSTSEFVNNNPDVVEKYLRSLVDAKQYLDIHPDETRSLIAQYLRYSDDYITHIWPKFNFEISLGQELVLTMESQARWAINNKLTTQEKVPNYLNFIYFPALDAVSSSLDMIHHPNQEPL
ncbi:MAG: NrtA/SsuA/CpmA family ABC transporter substrate-binding protein [Patescibacteria group bacterium]